MWASAFRVASCPKFMLIVKAVDDGMSSSTQLLLDNLAHLLNHNPQRNFRLRVLPDLGHEYVDVAIVIPTLVVQHVEIVILQKACISMIATGVHHPACHIIGAASFWCFNELDRLPRESFAWTVKLDRLPRES